MNKKQALKKALDAANEQSEELEKILQTAQENYESQIEQLGDFNKRCSADIRGYVQTILGMIDGKTPCESCEEKRLGECECPEKQDHGCSGWWLRTDMLEVSPPSEGSEKPDESEGILSASPTSGEGA